MKHHYRVSYVGNDSLEHRMVVWAEGRRLAAEEAQRRGAEFLLSVNATSPVWLWIAIGIGVAVALVIYVG